jgi:plasmid segregation protein ParM
MTVISLDLGNKQTKIFTEKGVKIFPSYLLREKDLAKKVMLFENELKISTYSTNFDSTNKYAWGKDILNVNVDPDKYINTLNFNDRYNKKPFQLLANFALGEAVRDFKEAKKGILECSVVTGVPTSDYNELDVAKLIKVLEGDHNIVIDGESHNVRVLEVHVMQQPLGTVYNEMLDLKGYMTNEAYLSENITVVDIGGGTLIVDTLRALKHEAKLSDQKYSGINTLYKDVVTNVSTSKTEISKITAYEVEKIIRNTEDSKELLFRPNKNEVIDITDNIEQEIETYTEDVLYSIDSIVTDQSFIDQFLFTGGGSNIIDKDIIDKALKYVKYAEKPETANVEGYYKYGKALEQREKDGE